MTEMPVPGRIGPMGKGATKEIKVVDLSERSVLHPDSPVHRAIIGALRRALTGILTKEELLAATGEHSFSEVERALRDLSLTGRVRVMWRTPFRFLAFLTEEREIPVSRPILVPAVPG